MPSVGILTLELRLEESHSLKDKRHFVKSLKDRLRSHDSMCLRSPKSTIRTYWQRGLVAVAGVSRTRPTPSKCFSKMSNATLRFY